MKKLNVKTQNRNVQFEQKLFQLLLNLLVLPVANVIRAFSIYSVFPIRLKGINQIMPSVITLAVLGISLIMLVYMTDTFKTALNSTNSLVVAVFDKLFGFYDLVASFPFTNRSYNNLNSNIRIGNRTISILQGSYRNSVNLSLSFFLFETKFY